MDAVEVTTGNVQIARMLGARRGDQRVEFLEQARRRDAIPSRCADMRVDTELDPFGSHLLDPAVDVVLLHLEIGNSVAQQPTDSVGLLEQHDFVAGAPKLLRACHSGRAGTDHGHALAGPSFRRLRRDPAFFPTLVDDEVLDRLDADRIVVDIERAGGFAWRRADSSGEFRKVVGRVQHFERLAPLLPVDEVIPVGNDVVDRAAGLTEWDAAVHAARALLRRLIVLEREDEFAVVAHALADRQRDFGNSLQLDEAGGLAHRGQVVLTLHRLALAVGRRAIAPAAQKARPARACTRSEIL